MAVSDQDKHVAVTLYAQAEAAKALVQVATEGAELLYPVDEKEKVGVLRVPFGINLFELWAVDRTSKPVVGVKVGFQDAFGRCSWKAIEE